MTLVPFAVDSEAARERRPRADGTPSLPQRTKRGLVTVTAATVKPVRANFAWERRVPVGMPTILAGPPGLGKTQLMIGLCAHATRGTLPGDLNGQPVDCLYVSAEDSLEHTLVPRFLAAGGDPTKIHFFTHTQRDENQDPGIQIPGDVNLIDEWLAENGARIVVLDPVVAMIPVALNAHRDQHVRQAFAPLQRMADGREVAVVAIMHLNKDREAGALNRISGSIAFGAAARSVLLFGADPDDPDGETGNRRILAHAKCNVGPLAPSVIYRIEGRVVDGADGPIATSIALRLGESTATASDLLGNPTTSREASSISDARDFLLAELADGPVPTTEVKQRADDADIAWRTVERAKNRLGVVSRKTGKHWCLELPSGGVESGEGKTATLRRPEASTPVNTGENVATPPESPKPPFGGLSSDEGKTAKTANTARGIGEGGHPADFDEHDLELSRLTAKFGDLADNRNGATT